MRGYYIDFRSKAHRPEWPRDWVPGGRQLYVTIAQWGLGCYERYLSGEGTAWLEAAITASDHLVREQEREDTRYGQWLHRFPYRHTYRIPAPWPSGMAQGEGASLLVRVWRETRDERYPEAALRALASMRVPVDQGGVRAELAGGFFPQEYPSRPASFVLNGGMFALWGCYDVATALDEPRALELFEEGIDTLAVNLARYDVGYWSRYDLFPHPVTNVASPAYHVLHINQLNAMSRIARRPEFAETAARFERYSQSRSAAAHALARKVLFRLLVPRNRLLAHRLPWSHRATARGEDS
jgi:hypothetical protein